MTTMCTCTWQQKTARDKKHLGSVVQSCFKIAVQYHLYVLRKRDAAFSLPALPPAVGPLVSLYAKYQQLDAIASR